MSSNSLYVGRFFGIPVRVHASWFLVFLIVSISLAGSYFPQRFPQASPALHWTLGIAASLLFFASVLAHELAHSVVARRRGLPVHDIVLFIFGGVSQISEEPRTPATELLMAIVGPLTSLVLGIVFLLLWLLVQDANAPLSAVLMYLGGINLSLGLFNLVPGFPLDGGRVLRALLWWRTRSLERSTRWASRVGQFVAYSLIIVGIWQVIGGNLGGGLWIAFIGWFLDNAAQSSYRQLTLRNLLSGHTAGEIMTRGCAAIPPEGRLQEVVDQHILFSGRRCLPVKEGDSLLGLLTVHRIKGFPREEWAWRTAREAMIPLAELRTIAPAQELVDALNQMAEDGVNQLPVVEKGQLVGLLTRENITTFLRIKSELGG